MLHGVLHSSLVSPQVCCYFITPLGSSDLETAPSLIAYISDDDYDEGLEAITATGDLLVPNRLAPTRLAGTESCAGPRPRGVVSNLDLGSTLRISSTGGAKPMAVLVRRGVNRRGRYSQMTSWTGLTASVTSLRP